MTLILLTGSTGFVGQTLCKSLTETGIAFRAAVKTIPNPGSNLQDYCTVGDIGPATDWSMALDGIDVVIHLANRAHVMNEQAGNPLAEYRRVNVDGTANFARQAVKAGVRRFIFVSSIKVNGEETKDGPFNEDDPPSPQDAYGISKWEAEQELQQITGETKMEFVILRPPLMYGPGVKANFLRLIQVIDRGFPLPLGAIQNLRSLISVSNLVDALLLCTHHPKAANQTFLISDNEDVSTPSLIRFIAKALNIPARLLPFSPFLIRLAGRLVGKTDAVSRLLGSLVIDSSKIRDTLGWQPPFTLQQGLNETAQWYNTTKRK